jgi:hypothetical protein
MDILTNILDSKRLYKATTGIRRADGNRRMGLTIMMKQKYIEPRDFILIQNYQCFKFKQPCDVKGVYRYFVDFSIISSSN